MKIAVTESGRERIIALPDRLIFSRAFRWIAAKAGRKFAPEAMKALSPEAENAMLAELHRIKKKYGAWTLLEVESANGEKITILF